MQARAAGITVVGGTFAATRVESKVDLTNTLR